MEKITKLGDPLQFLSNYNEWVIFEALLNAAIRLLQGVSCLSFVTTKDNINNAKWLRHMLPTSSAKVIRAFCGKENANVVSPIVADSIATVRLHRVGKLN
jgi:hypothetical protein